MRRKLVLAWELIHLIPRFGGEDVAAKYEGRTTPHEHLSDEFGSLFEGVDELFFDGNTVHPGGDVTNHMSIEAGLRFLIPQINPKRTWIVHYSGHEDPEGPMSDADLQSWVNAEKPNHGLSEKDILIGTHGMTLSYAI